MTIYPIAHIRTDFPDKFGVPRQSGLVPSLQAEIIFEPEYRQADSLRGLEDFSHIWILWDFSECHDAAPSADKDGTPSWRPTVRPPRLGGNRQMGVFATRSPFRPNHLGLSCVKLESIEWDTPQGAVLHVSGADLMDGTPIYDIKPYVRFTDSRPDAVSGFVDQVEKPVLEVECASELLERLPENKRESLLEVLRQDPRPAYQDNSDKVYGLLFAGFEVHFKVTDNRAIILDINKLQP